MPAIPGAAGAAAVDDVEDDEVDANGAAGTDPEVLARTAIVEGKPVSVKTPGPSRTPPAPTPLAEAGPVGVSEVDVDEVVGVATPVVVAMGEDADSIARLMPVGAEIDVVGPPGPGAAATRPAAAPGVPTGTGPEMELTGPAERCGACPAWMWTGWL